MAINPIVKQFDISEADLEKQVERALGSIEGQQIGDLYNKSVQDFELDSILTGKVVNVFNDDVIVDVGYKSEGVIPLDQFDHPQEVKEGDRVEVLLEQVEDESGMIALSKRKADRIRGWERVIATYKEGDVVKGKVTRKIKGGLLLEIGVPVFLPASQISIRRSGDISEFIGQEMECKIIKIDEARMNIVVSRRKLIEEKREAQKRDLLQDIEVGQIRKGIVKNITDFGAFVDLGGIDGLLHITDMSWGRITHPSEVLQIDSEIEVKVLKVDKEKERISLGLKQKSESPWANIETKYPVGSRIRGKVVNVLSYGAFVQLEEGVEGLVHISEMSWTKRINHPSQVASIGDLIDVVVLEIKKDKQEISLGMKQVDINPWTQVEQKYPPGTKVKGKVRNLTNYGAFVEIEAGIDGLLHVGDMSWTRKVAHPSEVVKKGDDVEAVVLSVDQERKRIALGLKQLEEDPWTGSIPEKYRVGALVSGEVTKITNFGVFVKLEDQLEGLLHISELADKKVGSPEEVVRVGQKVDVKIIKVDPENRKIGLSLKDVTGEDLLERETDRHEKQREEKRRKAREEQLEREAGGGRWGRITRVSAGAPRRRLGVVLGASMVLLAPARAEEAIAKDVRRALGLLQDESPQKRDEAERLLRAMGRRAVPQVKAWIARAEVHLDRVRQLLYRLGGGSPEEEEPLSAARPFLSRHVARAWERFHAGDYAGARRTAEAVLHLDPNSPEEWQIRRLIRQCEERLIRKEILEPTVEFRELVSGTDQDPRVLFRLVNHSRSAVGVRTERGILGMLEVSLERRYFDGSRRSDKRTIPVRTDGNEEKISLEPGGKYEREIVVPLEDHKPPRGMAVRVRVVGKFQPSQWGVEEKNLSRTLSLPPAECWVVASGEKTLADVPLKKLESALFFRDIHSFFTGGQLAVWAAEDDPLFHQKLLKLLVRSLSELDESGIRVADVLLEEATGVKRNTQRAGSLEITDHWQRWYEDYCRRTAIPSGGRSPK